MAPGAFRQAGAAGAVAAVMANTYAEQRPVFTIMEAEAANCYYRSFSANRPVAVKGDLNTLNNVVEIFMQKVQGKPNEKIAIRHLKEIKYNQS